MILFPSQNSIFRKWFSTFNVIILSWKINWHLVFKKQSEFLNVFFCLNYLK